MLLGLLVAALALLLRSDHIDAACCCEVLNSGEYEMDWCDATDPDIVHFSTGIPFPNRCQETMENAIADDYDGVGRLVRSACLYSFIAACLGGVSLSACLVLPPQQQHLVPCASFEPGVGELRC